jgi:hypothetical protein
MKSSVRRLRARASVSCAALLLGLLHAATASAQAPAGASRSSSPAAGLRVIELAIEARAADLSLPLTDAGSVTVRACSACKPVALLTGARARYTLDLEAVTLSQLRAALRAAPETAIVVFHARGGTEITRIVATSPAAANR